MPTTDFSREYAQSIDASHPLSHFRSQFLIPTKKDLKRTSIKPTDLPSPASTTTTPVDETSIYLVGNSLGAQPAITQQYVATQLATWATQGVHGHFKTLDSQLKPWMNIDEEVATHMSALVGAKPAEVAVMQTLTANLHFLMAAFYKPTPTRHKIILEAKAFPSDHFVVQSQLAHHNISQDSMILIQPPSSEDPLLPTEHILSIIDAHAESTALLLLPGIQFYTGQWFDMPRITAHAKRHGITVGWDLAHAAGNVPMSLHDWDVDFAAWCTYKYINAGPGATGALFVHEKHTFPSESTPGATPNASNAGEGKTAPSLKGWWGSTKSSRFKMNNIYDPIPGAQSFQLSNPSALDLSAVAASLSLFSQTDISTLRRKSEALTSYLEDLLDDLAKRRAVFRIITPRDKNARGAQLSLLLEGGLLESVMDTFDEEGVVVDERKPDVIRVAPAPLYNNWEDCWRFVRVLEGALVKALEVRDGKK